MGKLAMWGAVAGAGKGLHEVSTERQKAEIRAGESKIDHERNMAIERFRATKAEELESQRQEGATDRTNIGAETDITTTEMQVGGAQTRTETTTDAAADRQNDQQAFQMEESSLDRASAERIASLRASASSASIRAALERFEPKVLTVQEAAQYGMTNDVDTPAVYDKQEGRWYVQEGNRYILPGTPAESIRRAPTEAENHLFSNPGNANSFLSTYSYLPMGFLNVLRGPAGTSGQGGMLTSGRDAEPQAGQE